MRSGVASAPSPRIARARAVTVMARIAREHDGTSAHAPPGPSRARSSSALRRAAHLGDGVVVPAARTEIALLAGPRRDLFLIHVREAGEVTLDDPERHPAVTLGIEGGRHEGVCLRADVGEPRGAERRSK